MIGPEFYSVGIGTYSDESLLTIDEVDNEVAAVRALLERFDVSDDIPWTDPRALRGMDIVEQRLRAWARPTAAAPREATILYWLGHGLIAGDKALLATGTTDLETSGGTLDVDRLATYIALRGADEDVRDRWMLIVVDACKSAAFVSSLGAALLSKQTPLQYLLLATSERASMSQFGRFRQALELALESFRSVEQVTLCRLVREIK